MKQFWKKNFILRSYKTKEPRIEVVGETLQYALIEEKKKKRLVQADGTETY